jgi:hypothetical protein
MTIVINETVMTGGYIHRKVGSNSVLELFKDSHAPRYGMTVTGYGAKVPLAFRIRFSDNRIRRVYVMVYGNSGSAYVIVNGITVFIDSDIEHNLMKLEG